MVPHPVVIIHGMGESHTPGYSQVLQDHLAKQLDAAAGQLRYYEVNWSDIGRAEERDLLDKGILPQSWFSFNPFNLLGMAAESMDKVSGLSNDFRRFMVTSIGDVFTYLTLVGKREIQERLKAQILAARDDQLQAGVKIPYISIIAHSLGSVVAYDLARYFELTPEGRQEIGAARLANFFSFGSPLALFSLLEYKQEQAPVANQQGLLADGQTDQEYQHPYSRRGISLDLPEGKWLNFYDQQDPIATPLDTLYANAPVPASQRLPSRVVDLAVQTGVLHSHTRYWENGEVAQEIAKQLKATLAVLQPATEQAAG
jgi:hypothetical protein